VHTTQIWGAATTTVTTPAHDLVVGRRSGLPSAPTLLALTASLTEVLLTAQPRVG
jgi:hypothetical protein